MAFNPTNFKMPKRSKSERLLAAHGYEFGRTKDGVMSIIKTKEQYIKDHVSPDATPDEATTCYAYCRYDVALYSEPNETFSHWMERIGWLVKDEVTGKLESPIPLPEY